MAHLDTPLPLGRSPEDGMSATLKNTKGSYECHVLLTLAGKGQVFSECFLCIKIKGDMEIAGYAQAWIPMPRTFVSHAPFVVHALDALDIVNATPWSGCHTKFIVHEMKAINLNAILLSYIGLLLSSPVDLGEEVPNFLLGVCRENLCDDVQLRSIPPLFLRQQQECSQPMLPIHNAQSVLLVLLRKLRIRTNAAKKSPKA